MQTKSFLPKSRWLVTIMFLLTLGISQMWGMNSNYTIGSKVTSLVDGDYVAWGTSTTSLATSIGSNWVYCGATKADWIVFKVVKNSSNYYLQNTADNKYVYSSATKKVAFDTSNKTAITLDNSSYVYGGSSIGTYTYNSSGIRPYTSNKYTAAYLYKVNAFKVTYNANNADEGTVPTDNGNYLSGASVTVKTNSGSLTRAGYTFAGWNTKSDGTGTTYAASGSVTFSITASTTLYAKWTAAGGCTADVGIGAASINGTFNLTTVGVQCASITPGTNCAVTSGNYGFIWYSGTGDKEIGGSGVTRVDITSGAYSSGSFSTNLSSTFTVDQTYTFRAFAQNNKPSTAYSAAVSFTPRSIAFNSNGGSSVSTIYVNSGTAATAPSAPTKSGCIFGGWYKESGLTNAVNWSDNITASTTYYAKWYTVTVNMVEEDEKTAITSGPTVTFTPGTNALVASEGSSLYAFKTWKTPDGASLGSSATTANNSLTSPTKNVTVTAVFYKPISVTWKVGEVNASGSPTGSVKRGTQWKNLTLPTTPADNALNACSNKFMGWTNGAELIGTGNSAPAVCLKSFSNVATTITAPITFRAVFATESGGGSYSLVTSSSSLSDGDVVLIVTPAGSASYSGTAYSYSAQALSTTVAGSTRLGGTNVTISGTSISSNTATEWTLSGNSSDGWKIHNGDKYLYGTAKNGMSTTTTVGDALVFPISIAGSSPYAATIGNVTLGSDNCHIDFSATAAAGGVLSLYFALYVGSNKGVYIYKTNRTYANYVTKCCTKHDISLASSGSVSGGTFEADLTSACDGETVTLIGSEATGYNFASWTITDDEDNDITSDVLGDGYDKTDDAIEITMPDGAITVSASFTAEEYSITLDRNGGSSDGSAKVKYDAGALTNISAPTRASYVVVGYFAAADGDTKVADDDGTLVADVDGYTDEDGNWNYAGAKKLYAHWVPEGTYRVTITPPTNGSVSVTYSGGSALTSGYRDIDENTVLTITATPASGAYHVSSLTVGGSPFTSGNTHTLTSNITITAIFAINSYSVSWMVNGEEWSDKGGSPTVEHGSHITTLPTAPDSEDFCGDKFVGWTTVADYDHGTSPLYTTASGFPNATTNQTFYAVFADYNE